MPPPTSDADEPVVGVCIPVYDEVDAIVATLRSVWATDYPRDRLRVVVAVDGGDARVAGAARAEGATVVEVVPNQGSYAARNAALAALDPVASCVLFTDTDCEVAPGWVRAHVAALENASLSGGGVDFRFAHRRPNPAEWVDSTRHLRQQTYVELDGFAATCNLAVRRDVFARVQFDPTLRTGGDADFCLRAKAAGFDLVYT
ncbi:MAG TPA: glycosyltransferase, partial [Acidimicrobiales bacterium]|nr:glycosyltransferase [Acidimicrobiales bacterium]